MSVKESLQCAITSRSWILLCIISYLAFLSGIGSNLGSGPAYTICSDTMDEVERLTGKRPQGIMTSVMMCTMKLGVAASGIIFSAIMNVGGYVADAVQTTSAITAIHWNLFWLPICLAGICLVLALFFNKSKDI